MMCAIARDVHRFTIVPGQEACLVLHMQVVAAEVAIVPCHVRSHHLEGDGATLVTPHTRRGPRFPEQELLQCCPRMTMRYQ